MLNETSHLFSHHPGCNAALLGEDLLLVQRITVPSSGGCSSLGTATALSCSSSIMNIQNISSRSPVTSKMTGVICNTCEGLMSYVAHVSNFIHTHTHKSGHQICRCVMISTANFTCLDTQTEPSQLADIVH